MQIHHILVPVDFSTCALQVAAEAGQLAAQTGARLTLLHVASLPEGLPGGAVVLHDGVRSSAASWVEREALERLGPMAAAARASGAAEVGLVVRGGPLAPTIHREAEHQRADLILMGTHGREGLARAVLGSVAEEVTRHARVPVLLVRRQPRPECGHTSCAWCPERGESPAEEALQAELSG